MNRKATRYTDKLRQELCPLGLTADFDNALAGDTEGVVRLVNNLNRAAFGPIAVAMHLADTPNLPARRLLIRQTYIRGNQIIPAACRAAKIDPRDVFRAVAFDIPASLPNTLTVWRGTHAVPINTARCGLSWTPDKGAAAWFAMRAFLRYRPHERPLLLRRDVPLSAVVFHEPAGAIQQCEEVVFDAGHAGHVDGTPDEWGVLADAWEQRIRRLARAA